jgi:NADH-quinone oxidoreductase subunit E
MSNGATTDEDAVADGPDDERIAKESARAEPAPAPSADIPPKNGDRP